MRKLMIAAVCLALCACSVDSRGDDDEAGEKQRKAEAKAAKWRAKDAKEKAEYAKKAAEKEKAAKAKEPRPRREMFDGVQYENEPISGPYRSGNAFGAMFGKKWQMF